MEKRSVEAIIQSLNDHSVRYLVAGGLAVVAHGHLRFTADVDLILDLEERNTRRALTALSSLGYRPRAPVPLEAFADPAMRMEWIRDKGLTVFSLHSPAHPATEVDLFVEAPLAFDKAYGAAKRFEIAPDVSATFVGYNDLVALKTRAARPLDLDDLEKLREINETDEE
jgi:hypothetical protein